MSAQTQPLPEQAESLALALVLERFRLLARRRTAWLRRLWAEEGEPVGNVAITHGEVNAILDDRDAPEAEETWAATEPWAAEWGRQLRAVEDEMARDTTSRLARLKQIFGLSPEESDLFEACLAVSLDPSLARLCAYLQDQVGRAYMTEELAARLYGHGRCGVWNGESVLYRWALIAAHEASVHESRALACDPQVRDWLRGRATLHEALVGIAHLQQPYTPPPSWPLEETVEFVQRHVNGDVTNRTRLTVLGARGSGRRTFAAAVSAELRLPLLAIDTDQIDDVHWRHVYLLAQRHGYLERMALAWYGASMARRVWPSMVPPFPLQFVIAESGQEPLPCADVVEHQVRMPSLSGAERAALWRQYVPTAQQWPEGEFRALVERYRVHVGDIATAAQSVIETPHEAGLRVREAARGRLGNLAQLLRCPFQWADLVVPTSLREVLEDIVFEANHRAMFWEQDEARRLFPQGQGLMALFSGPPGTGKTMAAQVMAATLGYDLFRVDLAGVVSKWVGETSQNFERILTRAADMHAMILFDECDAIFTKRTSEVRDAQDKYANTDAAYLLQAIESYPGIALLATNQKGNIDPAFIRRLRYVLEFAKPDVTQRLELWRKVVQGLAGEERVEALDSKLQLLAEAVDATGAQIKYAILGAIFIAQREAVPLELRHLLRGLERELAKEGRALSTRDRERMLSHAG
jgi:AAA+ superfamily predicted ATPase